MITQDNSADLDMNLKQIIAICDLIIETTNENIHNILTIRDLASFGLEKLNQVEALIY